MNSEEPSSVFDAFTQLGLSRSLTHSAETIESAWHELSKTHHPDAESGNADLAASINRARQILQSPVSQLRHWLELHQVEIPKDIPISDSLMTLFTEAGTVTASTDAFLKKKKAATTAISKALLTGEEFSVQEKLQGFMQTLKAESDAIVEQFSTLEAAAENEGNFANAIAASHLLGFLSKWERECRERLISILA